MEMRIKQQAQRAIEEHYQQNSLVNIYPDLNVTGYNRNILLLGQVLTEEDKAIAEKFNQNSLYTVWICPKCGKDNGTQIKITE